MPCAPYPPLSAGESAELETGPAEVLHLAATCDLTGTVVEGTGIAAVFSSAERAQVPVDAAQGPQPPPGFDGVPCCTNHVEAQLSPEESWGRDFFVPLSPDRSADGYREPDLLRMIAGTNTAAIITTLPPPHDAFVLAPGEHADIWVRFPIGQGSVYPP